MGKSSRRRGRGSLKRKPCRKLGSSRSRKSREKAEGKEPSLML